MTLPETDVTDQLLEEPTATGWPQNFITSSPSEAKPPQLSKTSEKIGKALESIATGVSEGEYPALDTIVGKDPERYQRGNRLIADVRPPMPERMAVAEHQINDLNRDVEGLRQAVAHVATKDDTHKLDRRIDNVHRRIDRDGTDIYHRVERLENKRVLRDYIWGITLIITAVYSIIMTYQQFVK